MGETLTTVELVRVSTRGREASAKGKALVTGFAGTLRDLYDEETNPDGFIMLGLAENRLMAKELISFFKKSFRLSLTDFGYANSITGTTRLHTVLASFFNDHFKPHTTVLPSHVTTGPGASTIINRITQLIASPGDAILIAAPYYSGFDRDIACDTSVKAVPVFVPSEEMFGMKEVERMEGALNSTTAPKVAGIFLCNPHNPLGRCYPRETILAYARLCQKYGIHLVSDEIYACSVFENPESRDIPPFMSLLSFDWQAEGVDRGRVHVIYGMSKDFGANGFRVGVLVSQGNEEIMEGMLKTAAFDMIASPADRLWSTLLSEKEYLDYYLTMNRARLAEAYTFITHWLRFHSIPYIPSNAGHFVMADFRHVLHDTVQYGPILGFSEDMSMQDREHAFVKSLSKIKILASPGTHYHHEEFGWLRITFTLEKEVTKVGLARVEEMLGWARWVGLGEARVPVDQKEEKMLERERRRTLNGAVHGAVVVKPQPPIIITSSEKVAESIPNAVPVKDIGLGDITNASILPTRPKSSRSLKPSKSISSLKIRATRSVTQFRGLAGRIMNGRDQEKTIQ